MASFPRALHELRALIFYDIYRDILFLFIVVFLSLSGNDHEVIRDIILSILLPIIIAVAYLRVRLKIKETIMAEIEGYPIGEIERNIRDYVQPWDNETQNDLVYTFSKQYLSDKDKTKYFLITGNMGSGKTAFLMNTYLQYKLKHENDGRQIKVIKLLQTDPLDKIENIENDAATILLLDALEDFQLKKEDENKKNQIESGVKDVLKDKERPNKNEIEDIVKLVILIQKTRNFSKVVITYNNPARQDKMSDTLKVLFNIEIIVKKIEYNNLFSQYVAEHFSYLQYNRKEAIYNIKDQDCFKFNLVNNPEKKDRLDPYESILEIPLFFQLLDTFDYEDEYRVYHELIDFILHREINKKYYATKEDYKVYLAFHTYKAYDLNICEESIASYKILKTKKSYELYDGNAKQSINLIEEHLNILMEDDHFLLSKHFISTDPRKFIQEKFLTEYIYYYFIAYLLYKEDDLCIKFININKTQKDNKENKIIRNFYRVLCEEDTRNFFRYSEYCNDSDFDQVFIPKDYKEMYHHTKKEERYPTKPNTTQKGKTKHVTIVSKMKYSEISYTEIEDIDKFKNKFKEALNKWGLSDIDFKVEKHQRTNQIKRYSINHKRLLNTTKCITIPEGLLENYPSLIKALIGMKALIEYQNIQDKNREIIDFFKDKKI